METKFNIIYFVKFFDGRISTGRHYVVGVSGVTKESVEQGAMETVLSCFRNENPVNGSFNGNIQKIDITVTQIQ